MPAHNSRQQRDFYILKALTCIKNYNQLEVWKSRVSTTFPVALLPNVTLYIGMGGPGFLLRIITFIISEKNFYLCYQFATIGRKADNWNGLNVLCEEMKSGTTKKLIVKRSTRTQPSKEKVPAALTCEPWGARKSVDKTQGKRCNQSKNS